MPSVAISDTTRGPIQWIVEPLHENESNGSMVRVKSNQGLAVQTKVLRRIEWIDPPSIVTGGSAPFNAPTFDDEAVESITRRPSRTR